MPDGDFQVINKHAVGKATAPRISMTFRHIPTSQLPKQTTVTNKVLIIEANKLLNSIKDGSLRFWKADKDIIKAFLTAAESLEVPTMTGGVVAIPIEAVEITIRVLKQGHKQWLALDTKFASELKKDPTFEYSEEYREAMHDIKHTGTLFQDMWEGLVLLSEHVPGEGFSLGVITDNVPFKAGEYIWNTHQQSGDTYTNYDLCTTCANTIQPKLRLMGIPSAVASFAQADWSGKFPNRLGDHKAVIIEYEGTRYIVDHPQSEMFSPLNPPKANTGTINTTTWSPRFIELTADNLESYYGLVKEKDILRTVKSLQNTKLKTPYAPTPATLVNKVFKEFNTSTTQNLTTKAKPVKNQEDIQLSLRKKVRQKVKNIMDSESLQDNLDNIFDILGQAPDSPNFEGKDTASYRSHLKRILDEIIKNTGDKLGNTTVTLNSTDIKANGEANITQDSLTVNSNEFTPRTYAEQSGQEVYIHEILHILTRDALKTDTVFKNKVNKIRTRVRNILKKHDKPYEIFLHKNPDGSIKYLTDKQAEEDAAKEMYDYVFGENVPEEGVLDEFLAYSLTNQFLVKELSSMPATDLKLWRDNTTDTVIEKIVKLIFTVFEKISNKLSNKDMPANTAMELYVLTKDLVTINDRQRGRVTRTVQGIEIGKHLDAGNESIKKFFGEMVDKGVDIGTKKYFELVDKWTKDGKVNNFVANLLYSSKSLLLYASHSKFIEDHPRVKKLLNDKFKYFGDRTKDNFSSVVSDFTGNIDIRFSKLLFKSQKQVDINRNQDKAATVESLLDAFLAKDELTDFEQVALTKALLKPDISALITEGDYTIPEVMALLVDDVKLQQTIDSYYNKLNLSKFKDYAVQTDELAEFMVRGKVHNYEQYKNVHAIHNLSKKQIKGKNVVKDLNIYVTLLAIKKTEKVNREVAKKVSDREYAVGPDKDGEYHNGITHLLHFHYAIKQEVLEDGFHNNPMLVSKGYIADIIDEDVKMEFAPLDLETQRAMNTKEFKLVKRLGHITGVTNANMGLYASKNNPKSKRVKAIVSLTSMQNAGYTIKEIWANNPDTAKGINERFEAFKELQQSKKGQLDKDFTMLPILDEWGNTVNYSVHMNHALKEELLGQNLGFADVMATTLSRHRDKVASKAINVEVVQLLHEYKLENYDKNPNKFIDILSPAYIEEYFVPLPSAMKNEIMQRATEGKSPAFYLERKYLDYVFGYILPSISELAIFKWNPKLQRYARVAEKFWQEMVALAKLNIVVKIPIVPTVNFLSNFFTSVIAGVPPKYAVKHWKEGIIELRHYTEDAKKLKLLDLRIAGNPSLKGNKGVTKKRKMLLARMNSNPVAPFVEKGLFNSITEDINQNDYTYRHKIGAKIGKTGVGAAIKKHTKGTLFNIANQAYMGESTATFKAAMHFTQMSDFIARYTLYKYQTEQRGLSKDVAWKQMVDTFVSYDQPLNRYIQWGNDMGALFFIKYAIRIQRATLALLKDKPLNVGMLVATTQLGGLDVETIFESSFLTGSFNPAIQDLSKTFFEVVVPPGVEILSGEGF